MNAHPVLGAQIIAPVTKLAPELPIIRHHHEWYNGSGYPDRLIGDEIPKLARILHVADAFEAMTAARPYRMTPLTNEQALAELRKFAGVQFDPEIVDAFVKTHHVDGVPDPGRPAGAAPDPADLAGGRPDDRRARRSHGDRRPPNGPDPPARGRRSAAPTRRPSPGAPDPARPSARRDGPRVTHDAGALTRLPAHADRRHRARPRPRPPRRRPHRQPRLRPAAPDRAALRRGLPPLRDRVRCSTPASRSSRLLRLPLLAGSSCCCSCALAEPRLPGHQPRLRRHPVNAAVIVVNGGYMPIWEPASSPPASTPADIASAFHYVLPPPLDADFLLHLGPLGDIIPIPIPFIHNVASSATSS